MSISPISYILFIGCWFLYISYRLGKAALNEREKRKEERSDDE